MVYGNLMSGTELQENLFYRTSSGSVEFRTKLLYFETISGYQKTLTISNTSEHRD